MKASLAPSERVEASRNDNAAVNTSAIPAAVASESASQKATPATAPASSQNDAVQTVTAPANNVATEAVAAPDASATAAKASASAPAASTAAAKPTIHFNEGDAFCVIIASFPDADQANVYLKEHSSKSLGVLQQDGKYRVYAATGATYEEATTQKSIVGNGAWICRR
jgi:cell division septation protein DedD